MDIALVADKGGVGKSTLSVHIATRLKQLGRDVAIVDLDHRRASSSWIQAAEEPYLPAFSIDEVESRPDNDIVIWDLPAHPDAAMKDGLAGHDLVIIVTQPDYDSLIAAVDLSTELGAGGVRTRVLVNDVWPTGSEGAETVEILREQGADVFGTPVRRYSAYRKARWAGHAVCDGPYPSADQAWSDIIGVTAELLELLEVVNG